MSILKLVVILCIAFSFSSLPGGMSKPFQLPILHLARANPQPCQTVGASGACSEFWYPAGPEMNTELAMIFSDSTSELLNIQSGGSNGIDLTDSPLPSGMIQTFTTQPNFRVSAPAPGGFGEIEFNLANNFWGCNFSFGNSACGVDIREGIAHLIDKTLFVSNEGVLAGQASAIDNPESAYNGGLPSPNPCRWDSFAPESGSNCVVGAPGGTAFHFNAAAGAQGYPWLQQSNSMDFCVAAWDIMTALGYSSPGSNPWLWVVNGPTNMGYNMNTYPYVANPPSTWIFHSKTDCHFDPNSTALPIIAQSQIRFFVRTDNLALKDLGTSLSEEICYMWTGSYSTACPELVVTSGPITAFPGFGSSCNGNPNQCWGIYTSGAALHGADLLEPERHVPDLRDPFDTSLYFTFNSRFVSGVPSIQCTSGSGISCSPGPCSAQSVSTVESSDYVYLCSPNYDSMSAQMENAPCLTASGDPTVGSTSNLPSSPGNGLCQGTSQLSAISAGVQAENLFGQGAYTIPIFSPSNQYGYLSNWSRIINNAGGGIPSYFTWLNAHSSNPAQPGTMRQGMSEPTRTVNPYIASTFWDLMIVGNVYDTLFAVNPLSDTQFFDWMTISVFQESNSSLTYTAPPHTLTSYRFTLRNDLYFQDGTQVTSYDVAFSYLSMVATGAFLGAGATPMTGITVLSPHQFDIGVNSLGPFIFLGLTGVPIMPGRYWTCAASVSPCPAGASSTWDTKINACTNPGCSNVQYTLTGSAVNCTLSCNPATSFMTIDPNKITATFDPIAKKQPFGTGSFVGSGPWQCGTGQLSTSGSTDCSSTGAENPPAGGSYTLSRFGNGLTPASSISQIYFRSSGNLALWIWSEQNDVTPDQPLSIVNGCYLKPVDLTGTCAHFQQGIGAPNGGPAPVGSMQLSIESRFYDLNWIAPYEWPSNPPTGIGPLPPVLYEGSTILNPASIVGCTPEYPAGGYDC